MIYDTLKVMIPKLPSIDNDDDLDEDEGYFGIVLSDMLIQLLVITIVFLTIMILLPHEKEKAKPVNSNLGKLCVELSWDNARDVDIDLWGKSPGDTSTTGYSNMHSENLNMYRDVIGFYANPSHQNLEVMCANDTPDGEYAFNAYYFANHEVTGARKRDDPRNKIVVTMVLRLHHDHTSDQNFEKKFTMTFEKQEVTMMRFTMHNDIIDEGSFNTQFTPLYKGSQN